MKIKGFGDITALAGEFNRLVDAVDNVAVVQAQSMSGTASMRIRNGKWEIELGQ